jgi:hypothetical protein
MSKDHYLHNVHTRKIVISVPVLNIKQTDITVKVDTKTL